MSDINEIKEETEEIQSYRNAFGHVGFESSGKLIKNTFSLITTIESQKEEIESKDNIFKGYAHQSCLIESQLKAEIESLKAITELAVKGLQRVINIENEPHKLCPKCCGKGYHHGFGLEGHDPDHCTDCGGIGEIFVGQTEVATNTILEIERLSHE